MKAQISSCTSKLLCCDDIDLFLFTRTHLPLAGNDTVPIAMCHGGGIHSTGISLVVFFVADY